ncbi:MAG: ABC transporter ATP-binding protein [Marinilabiliaceae bacterium]|nr:ABC transporter ATP-binding protein [Marinilabiliaceae bacterium]
MAIVYYSSPKWTFINVIITILRGALPLLLLYVVQQIIDVVGEFLSHSGPVEDHYSIYFAVGLGGVFFFLNAITGSLATLVRERQSYKVNDYIQNIIHEKTVRIPYRYFEDPTYQNIFYRALTDAAFRPSRIFYGFLGVTQNILTLVLVFAVLVSLHWGMIPFLIVAGTPTILFRLYYSKKIYSLRKDQTEDERRVGYFNQLLTGKSFAKELRVFNLGETFKEQYESMRNQLRDKQWKLLVSKTSWEIIVQIISTSGLLLVFSFVVYEATQGAITNGSMAMYFLALQRGYAVLQELLKRISALYEDNLFLKNFFEFEKIDVSGANDKTNRFPAVLKEGISFKDVGFKYPNSDRWIFRHVNFSIPARKTVALVGANGSGKTTMVKLLAGLYEPVEGEIKADNVNWSSINTIDIAKHVSVIFQDFMLYNVSAADNVRFGNVSKPFDEKEVVAAAKNAGIHERFMGLENGYDTALGTLFKGSEQLSQGEWQRTALARSFYNPSQVIVLDEPTSSLDAFTEASLISHFSEIAKDRTAIIISHRLSTIKLADVIVVLDGKGVAEVGAPGQLLAQKGIFYQMVESLK